MQAFLLVRAGVLSNEGKNMQFVAHVVKTGHMQIFMKTFFTLIGKKFASSNIANGSLSLTTYRYTEREDSSAFILGKDILCALKVPSQG